MTYLKNKCLTAVEIFQQNSEAKYYLNEIRNLVSSPMPIYNQLYLMTLYRVAEFCQAMPVSEANHDCAYGLLKRQLKLTITALKLRRGILLPKNAGAEVIAAEDAQWTYALFSGCIVRGLDCLQTDREVQLHKENGEPISIWSPAAGSLYEKNRYYSVQFTSQPPLLDRDVFMAAIVSRILPAVVESWISTNDFLFAQWWEVLVHTASQQNELEIIIQRAAKKSGILL